MTERHKTGRTDLEAIEMGLRTTLHEVGAVTLEQLLQDLEPARNHRQLPCQCGSNARYVELRSKVVTTALGKAKMTRPYLCTDCGEGQFPVDDELDVKKTTKSPGVRRMLAVVGQEAPFDEGRLLLQLLAGLGSLRKRWSGLLRLSEKTFSLANKQRFVGRCNWIFHWLWGNGLQSSMCKWTGQECPW